MSDPPPPKKKRKERSQLDSKSPDIHCLNITMYFITNMRKNNNVKMLL